MAWWMDKSVVRGEIDNRIRHRVTGKVWLVGRTDPLELSLRGDCRRDIAGCRLTFHNRSPQPGENIDLYYAQRGVVGDMTASVKVRVEVPVERAEAIRREGGTIPEHMGNGVFLEWFSEQNGRVVIEGADFDLEVSGPAWHMSQDEERNQVLANRQAIADWIGRLIQSDNGDDQEYGEEDEDDAVDPQDDRPMDEFEWERELRESDRRTEQMGKLFEKYLDHPDRDRIIARVLDWPDFEEALDDFAYTACDAAGPESHGLPEVEPDPLTEGMDWIRTVHGEIKHPLSEHAFQAAMHLWDACRTQGLLPANNADRDLLDVLLQAQVLGAKLSGALDGLAYDECEAGYIVASLKRALKHMDTCLAAVEKVRAKRLAHATDGLADFKRELFHVREGALALMQRFRQRLN